MGLTGSVKYAVLYLFPLQEQGPDMQISRGHYKSDTPASGGGHFSIPSSFNVGYQLLSVALVIIMFCSWV